MTQRPDISKIGQAVSMGTDSSVQLTALSTGLTVRDSASALQEVKAADPTTDDSLTTKRYVDAHAPTAHAVTHEDGGTDEISVLNLSGLLADAQTPTAHAATHSNAMSDEITVENLHTAAVNTNFALKPDGAGGLAFGTVTATAVVWTVVTEGTASRSAADGEFILVNAATCVITLPAPSANARVALKVITGTVTSIELRTSGAGILIDGTDYSATGLPLAEQYEMINVISDGTNWFIF